MNAPRGSSTDLQLFAAAVAHEVRTPLTAIAGELEVALRRDRSAVEYRDALQRIAAAVSELVAISGDLAVISDPSDDRRPQARAAADLDAILARIRARYVETGAVSLAVEGAVRCRVLGDEQRLSRAVALVIEHAIRHRRPGAHVSVRVAAMRGLAVRIAIGADPPGFQPDAWSCLSGDPDAGDPLRLGTARRLLEAAGGALRSGRERGTDVDAVHIHLDACA